MKRRGNSHGKGNPRDRQSFRKQLARRQRQSELRYGALTGQSAQSRRDSVRQVSAAARAQSAPSAGLQTLEQRVLLSVSPFPLPLFPEPPAGSLMYSTETQDLHDVAGDADTFQINLDADQTVSILLEPIDSTVDATVEIFGPGGGAPLATATSGAAGDNVLLQSVPALTPGLYDVVVTSINGGVGNYNVALGLNMHEEVESVDGTTNDTVLSAEDISFSSFALPGGGDRLGVLGNNVDGPDFFSFHLNAGEFATLGLESLVERISQNSFSTGAGVASIAVGHFNADGDLDVAVTSGGYEYDGYYYGYYGYYGAGGAEGGPSSQGGYGYYGYNYLDPASGVDIYLGNGDGTFNFQQRLQTGARPTYVVAGDLNGDTNQDLFVLNYGSNYGGYYNSSATVVLGDGAGNFNISTQLSLGDGDFNDGGTPGDAPRQAVIGNFDGDSDNDLAIATFGDNYSGGDGSLLVYRNVGNDGFGNPGFVLDAVHQNSPGTTGVTLADINNDTYDDLITANRGSRYGSGPGAIDVYLGDGAGNFAFDQSIASGGDGTGEVAVVDLNGNSLMDLVAVNRGDRQDGDDSNTTLLFNNGAGGFDAPVVLPSGGDRPYSVAAGDLNADGDLDLTVSHRGHSNYSTTYGGLAIYPGDGAGGFGTPQIFDQTNHGTQVVTGDVDNDGDVDVFQASYDYNYYGNNGGFEVFQQASLPSLSLYDASGNLAALGAGHGSSFLEVIHGFNAPGTGIYTARVGGGNDEYTLTVTRSADFAIDGLAGPQDITPTGVALGYVGPGEVRDFTFQANVGDNLTINTGTPGNDPLNPLNEFPNSFDPTIEVFRPNGTSIGVANAGVIDGHNESISHTVLLGEDGLWRVSIYGESPGTDFGEYTLEVAGATGTPNTTFHVFDSSIQPDEVLPDVPPTFQVDLNQSILLTSVDAADLMITDDSVVTHNATSVTVVDHDTLSFDLPAGLTGTAFTVDIADSALAAIGGDLLDAFTLDFTLDVIPPTIIASNIPEGSVIAPGTHTFSFDFDEPLEDAVLDDSDVRLLNTDSNQVVPVDNFNYDTNTDSLSLDYVNLGEGNFELTVFSGPFAFRDPIGNDLDGEPLGPIPSGDGVPGGDFVVNFSSDTQVTPFNTPLDRVDPLGSVVFDPPTVRSFNGTGDVDEMDINLEADQLITIIFEPTDPSVQVQLELLDTDLVTPLATASAASAGDTVAIQTLTVATAGNHRIRATSLSGSGQYTVEVISNAATETEGLTDAAGSNDTAATAQDIDASAYALPGTADRLAVLGGLSGAEADFYSFTINPNEPTSLSLASDSGTLSMTLLASDMTTELATGITGFHNLDQSIEGFADATGGTFYVRVDGGADDDYGLVITRGSTFDLESNDTLLEAQPLGSTGQALGYAEGGLNLFAEELDTLFYPNVITFDFPGLAPATSDVTLTVEALSDLSSFSENVVMDIEGLFSQTLFTFNDGDNVLLEQTVIVPESTFNNIIADGTATLTFTPSPSVNNFYSEILRVTMTTPNQFDHYRFEANEGDVLTITTTTPAGDAGEPINDFDPRIELFNPSGAVVALDNDGAADLRNAVINYIVPVSEAGTYTVLVAGANRGEYTLSVTGNTGAAASTINVTAVDPADGVSQNFFPNTVTVDLSGGLDLTTVAASDLQITDPNSTVVGAQGVTIVDGDTLAFDIANANTVDGTYTLDIVASSFNGLAGQTFDPFTSTFNVDTTPPEVVSILANAAPFTAGDVLPNGNLTMDIEFTEPLNPATVFSGAVSLFNNLTSLSTAPAVTYTPGTTTVTLDWVGLPEGDYTLNLVSTAGRFNDLVGNLLDGVPANPGPENFTTNFFMDEPGIGATTPLASVPPAGSLIYDPPTPGIFHATGDVDSFTIDIDPGQTISVIFVPLDAGIHGSIELLASGGGSLGSATATAPGDEALIQTVPSAAGGTFQIDATSIAGAGDYEIEIILNAAVETEEVIGPETSNDIIGDAQDIDSSSVSLPNGADRIAAIGSINNPGAGGPANSLLEEPNDTRAEAVPTTLAWFDNFFDFGFIGDNPGVPPGFDVDMVAVDVQPFGGPGGGPTDSVLEVNLNTIGIGSTGGDVGTEEGPIGLDPFIRIFDPNGFEIDSVWDTFISTFISGSGVYYVGVSGFDNTDYDPDTEGSGDFGSTGPYEIDIDLFPDGGDEGSSGGVGAESNHGPDIDVFAFTLGIDEYATITVTSESGDALLELVDGTDTVLANGVSDATNVDQSITSFLNTTGAVTTYYARVSGATSTEYSLLVTRGSNFDLEPNSEPTDAQALGPTNQVLGAVGGGGSDVSSGTVNTTFTLFDGLGFEWEIMGNGGISDGSSDAYDGGHEMSGFGFDSIADLEAGGRELVLNSTSQISGLDVTRKTYVPDNDGFARFLDLFTNNTAAPIITTINYDTNLGSDGSETVLGTSSGDTIVTAADNWIVTDDSDVSGRDPAVGHIIAGNGPLQPATFSQPSGSVFWSYDITVNPGETLGILNFAVQDFDRSAALARTAPLENPDPAMLAFMSESELAAVQNYILETEDQFTFEVTGPTTLTIDTTTPGDDPLGQPINDLDPVIELFDPSGTSIASDDNSSLDGRNAHLVHAVTTPGTYRVVVSRVTGTGPYTLSVSSSVPSALADPPFQVATVDPVDGAILATFPNTLTIDFTDAFLLGTADVTDVLITDNIGATSANPLGMTVIDGDTLEFDITGLFGALSNYTVDIAGGALTSVSSVPLDVFSSTFIVDTGAPTVVAVNVGGNPVTPGSSIADGPTTFDVTFSEDMDGTNVDPTDILLVDNNSLVAFVPAAVNLVNDTMSVDYAGLPEGDYTLTLVSGADAFKDLVGNPLDGDGDTNGGDNYDLQFFVDASSAAAIPALDPVEPLGSLIYDPPVNGVFHATGDVDSFTVDVDADQNISVVFTPLDPSIRATLELVGPGGPLGSVSAALGGDSIALQNLAAATTDTYTINVTSDSGAGQYEVQVVLNASVEDEAVNGPANANDTTGAAEDITGSAIALVAAADRLAVVGAFSDVETDVYSFTLGAGQAVSIAFSGDPSATLRLLDGGGVEVAQGAVSGQLADQLSIQDFVSAAGGTFFVQLDGGTAAVDTDYALVVTRDASFGIEPTDTPAQAQSLDITGQALGFVQAGINAFVHQPDNLFWPNVVTVNIPNLHPVGADVNVTVGALTDLGASSEFLTMDIEGIVNSQLFVSGGGEGSFADTSFVISQADFNNIVADGTATFTFTPSSPVDNFGVAEFIEVGFNLPTEEDFYRFEANEGDVLVISTTTPGDDVNLPDNQLDPVLELLFDNGGGLAPVGVTTILPDGRNEQIDHTVAVGEAGTYIVRVASTASLGDYTLSVTGNTGTAPNLQVTATNPADGDILVVAPTTATVDFSGNLLLSSVDAADVMITPPAGAPTAPLSVSVVDGNTLEFNISNLPLADGVYTLDVVPGSIAAVNGAIVDPFSSTYTVDITNPAVTGLTVNGDPIASDGDIAATDVNTTVVIDFSEDLNDLNLGAEDLTLQNTDTAAFFAPDTFNYDEVSDTLTLTFDGANTLPEGNYALSLTSGADAFRDLVDNPLDPFTRTFVMDIAETAYPVPLDAIEPLGSLIYDPVVPGVFNAAGDTDSFTIALDADQVLTVVVTPLDAGIQAQVEIVDVTGGGAVIGSAAAPAADQTAVLQGVSIAAAGDYRIDTTSLAGIGDYTVQVFLNTVLEAGDAGGDNDSTGTAEDIAPSTIPLTGGADRSAVLGTFDSDGGDDVYSLVLGAGQLASVAVHNLDAGAATVDLIDTDGVTLLASGLPATNASAIIDGFIAPAGGTYFVRVNGDIDTDYSLTAPRDAQFEVEDNNTDLTGQQLVMQPNGGSSSGLVLGGGDIATSPDVFLVSLTAGDVVNVLTTTPFDGPGEAPNTFDPRVFLFNPSGFLVAFNEDRALGDHNAEVNWVAGETGTFVIQLEGTGIGPYLLQVDQTPTALDVHPTPTVVSTIPGDGGSVANAPTTLTLQFSEGMLANSFDLSDLSFTNPSVTVDTVTVLNGNTVEYGITVPNVEGTYDYTFAAASASDLQGTGNLEHQGSFLIDQTGPMVVATTPSTQASAPFNNLTFIFNEDIDPASVDLSDVASFSGPGGPLAGALTGISVLNNKMTVTFADQNTVGIYTMTIGPNLTDLGGNAMDQDGGAGSSDAFTVQLSLESPDLRVQTVDPLAAAQFGDQIDVTYSVINSGTDPAQNTWVDRIFLSTDNVLDVSDTELATVPQNAGQLGPLNDGDSYNRTESVTLPLDLNSADGVYFIIVETDADLQQAESNETNNTNVQPINLTVPPLPDLVVTNIVAPTQSDSGEDVQIQWTITNQGTGDFAGTFEDRLWLSTNNSLGGDQFFGDFSFTGTINAGDSIVRVQNITLPLTQSGDRWVIIQTDVDNVVFEGGPGEANNTTIDDVQIDVSLAPFPNLVVTSVTPPPAADSGQTVLVEWTVQNQGLGDTTTPTWYDRVYLSVDTQFDGSDIFLGQTTNPSFLAAGDSYLNSLNVNLPLQQAGDFHFVVRTDVFDQVEEHLDEGDNDGFGGPIPIALPPLPDLEIEETSPGVHNIFTIPPTGLSGQPITVNWTGVNSGTGATSGAGWWDAVYLSTDMVLDGSDTFLGQRVVSPGVLNPTDTYSASLAVNLPVGVEGALFLIVDVDRFNHVFEGALEDNNSENFDPLPVNLTPPPDLAVTTVNADDTVLSGFPLSIDYTVINQGATTTPNTFWIDQFFLSTDAVFDPGTDTVLGTKWHSGSLTPFASYSDTATFTIPADTPSGSFHVFVRTDFDDRVFEGFSTPTSVDNNIGFDPVLTNIDFQPADLTVVPLSVVAPLSAETGESIVVDWTVENVGTGPTHTGIWQDRIFLSADAVIDGADPIIGTLTHNGALAAGGQAGDSYDATLNVTIPFATAPGNYQLLVLTDRANQLFESNELNNVGNRPITITQNLPDLQISALSDPPAALNGGDALVVNWTVQNLGSNQTNVNTWLDRVYLSVDQTLSVDDVDLGATRRSNPLPGYGGVGAPPEYSTGRTANLPTDLDGTFYVIVQTDDQDAVIEGAIGETNNVAVSTTQVTVSPIIPPVPDLAVTLVDAPTAATSGQVFSLTFDVTNNGDDTPVRSLRHIDVFGGWYDAVYLSADQVFDPMTDAYLGFVNFVDPNPGTLGLANGESYSVTHDFTVPNGVSGNQYVFVNADRGNAVVNEATELNNVAYDTTAMNVTLPDPVDLVVESIVVPAAGTPGVLTSIDYTVRNLSPTVTATGSWRDTLYLSSDTTFDITDPVIGSVIVGGPVGPNATYTRTLNATLPAVTPGNYHVLVRTDILNQVLEVDETNNLGASITTMNADALALTLDVPFNGTLFEGQATFFRIDDVPAGETMRVNLDGDPDTASNQLFVSYGEVPTRTNFDFRFDNPFSADQQIIVPATRSGTYFVQLFGDDEPQPGGGTYDILADILGFELLGVTPDRGSNLGTATVIIDGSKISHDSDIQLVDTGGTITDAINTWWVNEAEVWATFDLQGLATGLYDVQVDDGVTTAVLPDAFEVTSDPAGQVEVDISGPAAVRPGRSGTVSINYANSGQTDVLAPIITLNVTNAVVGVPGAPGLFTDTLTFLGVNDMGPAGILAPGATASIALPFSPTASGGEMVFDLDFLSESMPEAALPIDWEASRAELMPITIDINAWDVIYDNYVASIGTTGADYLQVLSENASHLSMLGQRTNSLSGIQAFEIVQAAGLATIPVLAAAVDSSVAAPGRDLSITRTYANSIATRHEIGPYGYGWTHNYQRSLNSLGDGTVLYTDVIGGTQWFFPNGDGTYSDLNPTLELVQLPDATWQMTNQANTVEAYDPSGQLVSITDNNGNQITTTYTGGQLTRLDHSSGQFIDITYDGFGNIDSMTDSVGQTTTFGYDPSGQYLTSSTNAYSRVTTYTYDTAAGPAQHALTSITQPNSLTHTFFYNAQGHLSAFEGEAGDAHVDLIQDNVGTVHVVDLFGTSASIVFDDAARQARVVDTLGSVFQSQVDSLGQVIETVDALNRVTTYDVDDRSNITEILNAAGQDLEFVFDASTFGSLTESIDANRISTLHLADIKHGYPADGNGNPDQRIMDDGTFEFFTYNAEGQIQTQTNRRGQVITYGYDTDGNLTSKAYDDGTVFTYTYDAHGNQLTTTGLSGTITRTYDVDNNLIRVDYTGGSFTGQFVEFDYDVFGRRTQTLDHLGNELNASYDALGRLEELTDASSALVVGYTYDALSRVSTKTLANGVVTNFTYDSADQVTRAENVAPDTVTIQSFFDYTYDAAGQITAVSTHQGDWTYTYDAVGQLVGSDFTSANPGTIPDQQFVYTYDAIGNRTSSEVNGVVTNYTSNNLHQYTDVGANVDLQYDADGNLTQIDDGGVITTLTYNHENRLTSVDVDGGTDVTLFEYDANGRLTSVTENGVTRVMVQDPSGLGSIIGEYDPTGLLLQRFDYSGGLLRSEDGAGVETYYGFNATSHTSELTDATGVITDTYLYDPFGQIIDQTGSSDNGYQYAGELGVLNTGPRDMQFMRNRFYLPELGQFITEDPLRFEAQNNRTYVNNNPINGLDPIGLVNWGDAFWAGVGFVGSTVEAAAGVAIATATGVTGVGAVAGGAVAVHGAYGMGANAGNFINALFEVEPTLSGNMLQDVGMGVDAAAGTDVFENLGLAADLGIGLATGRGLGYLDDAARPPGWVRNNRALMDAAGDLTALLNSGNITQQQLRDLMNELNEQAPDGVRFVPVRDGDEIQIQIVRPSDPNDIVGPEGFGDERFVPADQPLDYRVRFENMEVATAPAQEVFVTMTLDPDLDFTTFRFEDFGFGDLFFDLPGTLPFVNETVDYTVTIDEGAGPVDVDILVNVFGTLDVTTGDVLITFTSLDPSTGALPDNPLVGFLPPNNDDGIGDAFFSYRVTPRSTAVTGDVIDAEATIVFDTEGPIATPPIFNTLDAVDPTSNVLPLAATQTDEDFLVQWTGSDDTGGSGVAHYTIYVSTNGAPFELWLDKTTLTESIFDGKVENDYAFYSVAEDNAGNTEDIPATADASTSVPDVEPPRVTEVRVTGNGWGNPQTLADGAAQLAPLGTGQVWTVQVVFSEDVVISQGDVSLVGATTAVPPVANFSYDSNTFTASLDLQSYLQPDTFTLTVADTVIDQAPAPNALDGDWTDGVSTYDSGDGTAGGSFEFDFNILPGDATGDGTVDAGDMALVGSQWGTAGPEGDLNRDGIVDIADLAVVGRNFGSSTGPSASSSQSSNVIGLSINSDLTPPAPANDQTQAVDLLQSDPSEVLADLGLDTVGLPAPSSVFFNRLGPSSLLGSQSSWNHIQDSLYGSGDNDPFSRFTKKKKGSNAGLIDLLGGEHLSL